MRSRNVSPGLAVIRTTSQSERTAVPPVTLLRSPPLSRITGALSPVIALSSTEATPSMTSPSQGITSPASTSTTSSLRSNDADKWRCSGAVTRLFELLGLHVAARGPQGVGLRLAASFGHRFGKIGKQHREPEPGRNAEDETGRFQARVGQRLDAQHGGQHAADIHGEHHRIAHLHARIQLEHANRPTPADNRRFEQGMSFCRGRHKTYREVLDFEPHSRAVLRANDD